MNVSVGMVFFLYADIVDSVFQVPGVPAVVHLRLDIALAAGAGTTCLSPAANGAFVTEVGSVAVTYSTPLNVPANCAHPLAAVMTPPVATQRVKVFMRFA